MAGHLLCSKQVPRQAHDLVRPTIPWPTITHDSNVMRRGSGSTASCSWLPWSLPSLMMSQSAWEAFDCLWKDKGNRLPSAKTPISQVNPANIFTLLMNQLSIKIREMVHLKVACVCFVPHQDVDSVRFFFFFKTYWTHPQELKMEPKIAKYVICLCTYSIPLVHILKCIKYVIMLFYILNLILSSYYYLQLVPGA